MFRKLLVSITLLCCFIVPVHADELREDEAALIERYETSTFKLGSCDATEYPKLPKNFIEAARQVILDNDFSEDEIQILNQGFDKILEILDAFVKENVIITAEEFNNGLRGDADDRFYDFTTLRSNLQTAAYEAYNDAGYKIMGIDGIKPLLEKDESLKKPLEKDPLELDVDEPMPKQSQNSSYHMFKLVVEVCTMLILTVGVYAFIKSRKK